MPAVTCALAVGMQVCPTHKGGYLSRVQPVLLTSIYIYIYIYIYIARGLRKGSLYEIVAWRADVLQALGCGPSRAPGCVRGRDGGGERVILSTYIICSDGDG